MRIHKEGRSTIILVLMAIVVFLAVIISFSLYNIWILSLFILLSMLVLAQTLMFFRIPNRDIQFRMTALLPGRWQDCHDPGGRGE